MLLRQGGVGDRTARQRRPASSSGTFPDWPKIAFRLSSAVSTLRLQP